MSKTKKVNDLVASLYTKKNYTELHALKELFSSKFLKGLQEIISDGCRSKKNFKESFNVSLGWIDKIPLASFVHPVKDINGNDINTKVELGDFILVYNHSQQFLDNSKKVTQILDNRALIVQAKKAKKRNPLVPITPLIKNKVNSTSKELALLSNWPKFDLYKASRSKKTILQNIQLDPNECNSKYCGYHERAWDFGSPVHNQKCTNSTGEIIMNLIDRKIGQKFNPNAVNDWDRLMNTLLELCGNHDAPGYIFGKNVKRLRTRTWEVKNTGLLFFFPFLESNKTYKQKLPILVINHLYTEGELANK